MAALEPTDDPGFFRDADGNLVMPHDVDAPALRIVDPPAEGLRSLRSLSSQPEWPAKASAAAWDGLAGDVVALIEPHSEADPHALLFSLLAAFGNAAGRGGHFRVEGDLHGTNLNVAVVGDTAKGRKGTSWGQIRRLMQTVDPEWAEGRIVGGLSSGEGLLAQVRDPVVKRVAVKERGTPTGEYVDEIDDHGEADKRLLVVEGELAQPLRVMRREGNTLSSVLRNLWDSGNVSSLTKNSPLRTTGAHVSIIGHITRDELRRELTQTDAANGFANRFLWTCSRRSKVLPDGGSLDADDLDAVARLLRACLDDARSLNGALRRDDQARNLWHDVYPALSEGGHGMFGAVTSRAEAQVTRLSVIYALLECSRKIKRTHLESALAAWGYAERSAGYLFGHSLGDPTADEILAELRATERGLTRTEIRDLFKRHKSVERIDLALATLAEQGLARVEVEQTGGRPRERWRCDQSDQSDQRTTPAS